MTKVAEHELTCPECGTQQQVHVWDSINVGLDPSLRRQLFDAEINMFRCDSCGHEAFLDVPLLYHDMPRRFCAQYLPPELLDDPSSFGEYTAEGKVDVGLSITGYLAEPHVVFEMDEMIRYIRFRELLCDRGRAEGETNSRD